STFPIEFRPSNPWPALDRRFRIASYFATAGCAVPEIVNDKWTQLVWLWLRSSGNAKTCGERDADLVFRWAAGQSAAPRLAEPIAMLDELEPRILAGQTNET